MTSKPHPLFDGKDCEEETAEFGTAECNTCPGQFIEVGVPIMSYDCKRPRPLFGGRDCVGSGEDTAECDTELPCPGKFRV